MRNRSMALVVRNNKILMEKLYWDNRFFYSIPGGGVEEGETPEMTALRELKEECGLDGTIVRKLTELYRADGSTECVFEVNVPDDQFAIVGYDPEEPANKQIIKDVRWMALNELPEKDRAFLWAYGLIGIDSFFKEILTWGDEISYPGK